MKAGEIRVRHNLEPGDLGMIVHLHGRIYAREYGLDTTFEPYVAKPLADFVLNGTGRLWIADSADQVVGSIAVVHGDTGEAQVRWFLLAPQARGAGLGKRMLAGALDYCRQQGMDRVFLWTFSQLDDALRLYERAGFKVTERRTISLWGADRTELRMDLELAPKPGA